MIPELLSPGVRAHALRIARRIVGPDDAEDVVQNAYVSALTTPYPFRGDSKPFTWFCRITVNESIMHLRRLQRNKRNKERQVEMMPEVVSKDIPADMQIEREERRRAILEAIGSLSESQKRDVLARYFIYPDLTVAEIAEIEGMHVQAVKANVFRGRQVLSRILAATMQ